jgi:SPP1 gp7 family putative phage head morphogenesis protein
VETVAGEQSKLIVGTMRDELRTILAESFDETDTERAKRIREHFNVRRDHANTIAWTESGKAYNFGTLEGFRQSGVVAKKEWLAILDEHTRDAHRDADGQVVGLDEFFLVDGELIQFPGAPGATAENSINCRCAMQPVVDQDLKAARIARKRSRVVVLAAELDELFAEPSTNGH